MLGKDVELPRKVLLPRSAKPVLGRACGCLTLTTHKRSAWIDRISGAVRVCQGMPCRAPRKVSLDGGGLPSWSPFWPPYLQERFRRRFCLYCPASAWGGCCFLLPFGVEQTPESTNPAETTPGGYCWVVICASTGGKSSK